MLIELEREIHSNTRRTRVTYRGMVNGKPAAIKCYRRPLFGLIHWARAHRRGLRIRQADAPVPAVLYSGWLPAKNCFCFATAFLEGYRPLRAILRGEERRSRQMEIVEVLGQGIAHVHHKGLNQSDGNLTNFMLGPGDGFAMVDEDDVRVFRSAVPLARAMKNLANIAARLPDEEMVNALLRAYIDEQEPKARASWQAINFGALVDEWRSLLESKRVKKNITPLRHFD